jgi:hypothetical protein
MRSREAQPIHAKRSRRQEWAVLGALFLIVVIGAVVTFGSGSLAMWRSASL